MLSFGPRGMRSRRRRRTTIGTGERAAWKRRKGETEGEVDRERTRRTRRGRARRRERETEDAEEQGEGEEGQGKLGWPKVARVEYWNALPEAISVRCPPFVLLSCSLQASSFPTSPLSLRLSSFLSVSSLCFFSAGVIFPSLSISPFSVYLRPSFFL